MIRARYLVVAMMMVAALPVLAGLTRIEASSGHWRVTAWMLDFVKRRAVATYSLTVVEPTHRWPSWQMRGAAHFEAGCRPCHGSPLSPRPPLIMRTTPHPPELAPRVERWNDRELFQIVRHGIKFTGMPAWMAPERPDEVWAMVAFLRSLPALSPDTYRDLAFGNTTDADGVTPVERCARCHGSDGLGRDGSFPVLAGQHADYLRRALMAFREDRRHSAFMRQQAWDLDERARESVVAYFAKLPRSGSGTDSHHPGAKLVLDGDPARRIPACSSCHAPSPAEHNPAYPHLAGQNADYLFEQLILFQENRRGGSEYAPIMQAIAQRLSRDQMRQAADYFGGR